MNNWTIHDIWNSALVNEKPREYKPRDYIYASELGIAPIDIYLRMTGVKPTNEMNDRAKRKTEMGNIVENIVKVVLIRAGIMISHQKVCNTDKVHGRLDFIAGGQINWEQAKRISSEEFDWLPEATRQSARETIQRLSEKYPNGLKPIVLDVKSKSLFMYEKIKKSNKPDRNKFQMFHYLLCENMDEGHLIYVNKDDGELFTTVIADTLEMREEYDQEVDFIYNAYKSKQMPQKEPLFVWEDFKISHNWKVSYSSYLTMLYGFKDETAYNKYTKSLTGKLNGAIKRVSSGKEPTKDNLEKFKILKELGFEPEKIIEERKQFLRTSQVSEELPIDSIT